MLCLLFFACKVLSTVCFNCFKVRTNHDRLIRLSDVDSSEQSVVKDSPLKLRTILDWSTKGQFNLRNDEKYIKLLYAEFWASRTD